LEGAVFLAISDVVGPTSGVFDTLMANGASGGDLRDGEPRMLRHGGEANEEGAFRFGEEAFLRLGGGQVAIEPRLSQVVDNVGDEIAFISENVSKIAQNATKVDELHGEFRVGHGALFGHQSLQAFKPNDDVISRITRLVQ